MPGRLSRGRRSLSRHPRQSTPRLILTSSHFMDSTLDRRAPVNRLTLMKSLIVGSAVSMAARRDWTSSGRSTLSRSFSSNRVTPRAGLSRPSMPRSLPLFENIPESNASTRFAAYLPDLPPMRVCRVFTSACVFPLVAWTCPRAQGASSSSAYPHRHWTPSCAAWRRSPGRPPTDRPGSRHPAPPAFHRWD